MTILETIAVAFSMYSAIPMPQFAWNDRNMKYAMCAFPLIGLVIGLLEWAAATLSAFLQVPALLEGAICCVLPVLVTGGIHLDGYCDTSDALSSHAEQQKKLEILKDPHIGSFAVIRLAIYFVFYLALWGSMPEYLPVPILLTFCLSRCLSGIAICAFPKAKNTGLAHLFAEAAARKRTILVLSVLGVLCTLGLCLTGGFAGAAALVSAVGCFAYYRVLSERQFGGITGDLAGWFLQKCELWMLAAICLVQFVEEIL